VDVCIHSPIPLHGVVIYYLSIGSFSPGVKRPGPENYHSSTNIAIKKTWIYTSTSSYAFMVLINWLSIKTALAGVKAAEA
jgi:hypothetical protein